MAKPKKPRARAEPSNAELELRWVKAWNQLYDVLGRRNGPCRLPDGTRVDTEAGKAYLQDSAYGGWMVRVEAGELDGQPLAIIIRWREPT